MTALQRVEIEVEIPAGFEATGEYRSPREGEWFLSSYEVTFARSNYVPIGPRLIMREKPLAYEDFEERCGVWVGAQKGSIGSALRGHSNTAKAREHAAALIAAADHVDRVNAQNDKT